jgi:hypothetical protein
MGNNTADNTGGKRWHQASWVKWSLIFGTIGAAGLALQALEVMNGDVKHAQAVWDAPNVVVEVLSNQMLMKFQIEQLQADGARHEQKLDRILLYVSPGVAGAANTNRLKQQPD